MPSSISDAFFTTPDGLKLPLRRWHSEQTPPRAIVIAVHGFNDYSNFFTDAGDFLTEHGIISYAYDQRGFGASPHTGLWPGMEAFTRDLSEFTSLVRQKHPRLPVYILGESMGGAIVLSAVTSDMPPETEGIILSAPAVWGRVTMPWYQRLALWIGVRVAPSLTLTGKQLKIMPSDNIEMLRAIANDPLFIKATRIDTVFGLVNLMDTALERSANLATPALILYGNRDEVIPKKPTRLMLQKLPRQNGNYRIALYDEGYHMLLRDLGAEIPLTDIVHWIATPNTPLPSGSEKGIEAFLAGSED